MRLFRMTRATLYFRFECLNDQFLQACRFTIESNTSIAYRLRRQVSNAMVPYKNADLLVNRLITHNHTSPETYAGTTGLLSAYPILLCHHGKPCNLNVKVPKAYSEVDQCCRLVRGLCLGDERSHLFMHVSVTHIHGGLRPFN